MIDLDKDYDLFTYPIWIQQQSRALKIASQTDFKLNYQILELPNKKMSLEEEKEYALKLYKKLKKVNEEIIKELRHKEVHGFKKPEIKKIDQTIKLEKAIKYTPPVIAELSKKTSKPVSKDTVRRMFDKNIIPNRSNSSTHREAFLEDLKNCPQLDF